MYPSKVLKVIELTVPVVDQEHMQINYIHIIAALKNKNKIPEELRSLDTLPALP